MQRLFISAAGTLIRLRLTASVLGMGTDIAAAVVIAAVLRALNFGDDVGLLVGLFFGALGALHTLFCHAYHLAHSVALSAAKIQGKI